MASLHWDAPFTLDTVFNPETFETIDESPVAYVTRAYFRGDVSQKPIAIKSASTRPHFSKKPHDIVKELRILRGLSHINVIDVLGHGFESATCSLNFWMPFISYKLRDLLDAVSFSPHLLPGKRKKDYSGGDSFTLVAKSLIYQIIQALQYLHGEHVAHRDIKPGNILITDRGVVKLIDFGIAWSESIAHEAQPNDLWPEPPGEMCFDVATGPYRAPELLFGPTAYDAYATDLWSLGATCAEFFAPFKLQSPYDDCDEDGDSDFGPDASLPPFIIPRSGATNDPDTEWRRESLFDASRGSIGLAWSIFKTRGTPTEETWPDFNSLPDAKKITFQIVPPLDLQSLLPNLPSVTVAADTPDKQTKSHCADLVERFLVYQPTRRIRPTDAARHRWFTEAHPILIPRGYPKPRTTIQLVESWKGKTLAEHLISTLRLVGPQYNKVQTSTDTNIMYDNL